MPLYLGSKTVSENINMGDTVIQNTFDLFDVKWSDHIINNESWMCADDFNWIDGSVFSAAWNELKSEWDLATVDSTPAQQDIIGDITINYWKSPKGYKLVEYGGDTPETNENLLQQLYDEVGIAWYYLIDTTGQIRFKLPRTKYGFVGVRSGAGNFVDESLPNITGEMTGIRSPIAGSLYNASGVFTNSAKTSGTFRGNELIDLLSDITFDASLSSEAYQDGANVQQKSTEMHLYFYLADFVRTPLESNLNTFITETKEALNEKVNVSDYSADKTLIENDINTLETTKITQTDLDDTINTQRTNCITKIPQNIKLEINDGTLTLKAGSKVYIPNGPGVFDEIIIDSDRSISDKSFSSGALVIFSSISGASIRAVYTSFCTSGTSAPTDINYRAWYDITNNVVKSYSEGSYIDNMSLPIAVCTYVNNEGFISIDQVFNGFGYIGSHWYELKGNEGTARNGRNADGSLNNSTKTTANVSVHACGDGTAEWFFMSGFDGNFRNANKISYFIQDEMPSASSYSGNYAVWESPRENIIRVTSDKGVTWTKTIMVNCGEYSTVDNRIAAFNPKTIFQAVDYYDFKQLDENIVHKTGDETINGVKTFLSRHKYVAPNIDTNVAPSSNVYNDFMVSMDKTTNNQIGYYGNAQLSNGDIVSRMGTSRKKEDGSYIHTEIQIGTKADGTAFTLVPTPSVDSDVRNIVNINWINQKFQVVSTLPASPNANVFYFVTNA